MEKFQSFHADDIRWSARSSPGKGPRRICKFCVLGVILPVLLLCIPLYMRFLALRPHILTLSPSDMKLLNHEHRVRIQTSDEYHIKHSYRDREGDKNERLKVVK